MEFCAKNVTADVEDDKSTTGVTEPKNDKDDATRNENDIAGSEVEKAGTKYSAAEENTDANANIKDEGTNDAAVVDNPVENEHEHDGNTNPTSDEKNWPGWPGETVLRILVPQHRVGGLIGKKGDIIKKICEEAKARIKVINPAPGASERAVVISAQEEPNLSIPPAVDALLRVHNRIVDGLTGEVLAPSKSGKPEVTRLLAGATQTGTLIGKRGVNIKSIQDASECVISIIDDVPPFALPNDKVVEIQGEPSGMHKALELIASHLRKYLFDHSVIQIFEKEMSRSLTQQHNLPPPQPWAPPPQPWAPPPHSGGPGYNPKPHYVPTGPHDNYYPPQHEIPPCEKPPHHGISTFGRDMPTGPHDNYYPPQHGIPPPYEKPPHHGISTFGRDVPPADVHPSNGSQSTQHMQVPITYADAVIGSAGSNISYIRRISGATITIQESKGIPGEMTVEITGSSTQVQTAQQLIRNSMAGAGAPAVQPPPAEGAYSNTSTYAAPPSYASSDYGAAPPANAYGGSYPSAYGYGY